ncbi:MAG: acylphosphatase [Candidatus Paceibacterota bacterium]
MKRIHIFISGKVQGVGLRLSCKRKADESGVFGWVKNLHDGRVEAVFESDKKSLDKLLVWCMTGMEGAKVTAVEKHEEKVMGLTLFEIVS